MSRAGLPRPRRAAVPLAASAAVLAVWGAVARGSGVGWVQTVGALVAGLLAVGLAGPALAVWRVRLTAVAAPADAVAGSVVPVEVAVRGAAVVCPLWPPGPEAPTGPTGRVVLELQVPHRGVLRRCTVEVSSAAPFGLLWWSRTVTLALPSPVLVAPRAGAPDPGVVDHAEGEGFAARAPGTGTDTRGVRPYVPGDRRSLVHWPATAHTGAMMVRDHERPVRRAAHVRGTLGPDPSAAEAQAERVLGTVGLLLAAGTSVMLSTTEGGGDLSALVQSTADAGRRLALALPAHPYDLGPGGSPAWP